MSTVINKKLQENDFKYRIAANLFTRDASSDVYKTFEKLAVSQKHITMYTHSGTHDKNNQDKEKWFKSLLDAFNLKEEELPLVLITDPINENTKHVSVKMDIPIKDMTFENVHAYVNRFKNHEFRPFTQSEPKPDNEGKNLKIVVGSTY